MVSRTLTAISGNTQRLDGGAMFGNAPRAVWERWIAPDERGEPGNNVKRILFETGIGAFFAPKMRDRFGVMEADHVLLRSLEAAGTSHEQIDVVVLSHLHFDHAGGLLTPFEEGKPAALLFPRATFVVGKQAWERARRPHARDKASFIPELVPLLEASGRLEVVDGETSAALGPSYRLHRSDGHTPGLVLGEVPSDQGPIVFAADLIPGRPWVHLPITMGYDRYPERIIEEKEALLTDLLARNGRLFFTHDAECAMGRLTRSEDGRFGVGETWLTPARLPI